jgi:polyribonucleotide 5'-hydroxyl-kinase
VLDQSIGTEVIRDIVAEFAVTVIVILGHERLYNDMVRRYSDKSGIAVVKLARSGGAVELNNDYVQQLQNYRTKQYFYGELKNVLSPVSRTLDFKNIKVYRLAEGYSFTTPSTDGLGNAATHASALPIGQEESAIAPEIELVHLESPAVLQHSILSITSVGIDEDPRGVLESNVLGFIFVYILSSRL